MSSAIRIAVVRDFRAEGWPSMDLCADQLLAHLPAVAPELTATDAETTFRRLFTRVPFLGNRRAAFNADRVLNRHVHLPQLLRRRISDFDVFHIVDHSYAHLVNAIPSGRAGVYCHDLDAFRCLLDPHADPRPWWFRSLARRTLAGMQAAELVFHGSREVGRQLAESELISPKRLVFAPYGISEEFSPTPSARADAVSPADTPADIPFLLNVGTNTQRKRLDVLLDVFATVRRRFPCLRLVQVGGPWPAALAERIERLDAGIAVTQVRGLSRLQLADLYRRAAAVLVTSEAEGFGLPVIEALACGAIVVASDLPVLRETGGDAAVYRPVGAVAEWADAVARVLTDREFPPKRETRLRQAARYSWQEHARVIGDKYVELASGRRAPSIANSVP